MIWLLPRSTLFPYTTLFRSHVCCLRSGIFRRAAPRPTRSRRIAEHHDRSTHNRFQSRRDRSEEHTSELQSLAYLVCRLLLEKKNLYFREMLCIIYFYFLNSI